MLLKFKKLCDGAKLPEYKTSGAAGMDVFCSDGTFIVDKNTSIILPTGLAVEVPIGYELQVRPRSGLASKGLIILNSPGTIDSDYRGEIKVLVYNLGQNAIEICKGDRIAQFILNRIEQVSVIFTPELNKTERGENGFGSTGK